LSVTANPNCKSREQAEQVVNEVWESCWPDTRPFDEASLFSCFLCQAAAIEHLADRLRRLRTDLLRKGTTVSAPFSLCISRTCCTTLSIRNSRSQTVSISTSSSPQNNSRRPNRTMRQVSGNRSSSKFALQQTSISRLHPAIRDCLRTL
jgi:hypothetical protein